MGAAELGGPSQLPAAARLPAGPPDLAAVHPAGRAPGLHARGNFPPAWPCRLLCGLEPSVSPAYTPEGLMLTESHDSRQCQRSCWFWVMKVPRSPSEPHLEQTEAQESNGTTKVTGRGGLSPASGHRLSTECRRGARASPPLPSTPGLLGCLPPPTLRAHPVHPSWNSSVGLPSPDGCEKQLWVCVCVCMHVRAYAWPWCV